MKIKSFVFLLTVFLLSFSATPVLAQDATPKVGKRLGELKMKACQSHEESLQQRMTKLTNMTTNMQNKFAAHAQRVEDYYTDKVISAGKNVANYDQLVVDVENKNTKVSESLAKAQTTANNFSCEAENPKQVLTSFRKDMQSTKMALKEYRIAIKNLIVAVRGVAKTSESPTATSVPAK